MSQENELPLGPRSLAVAVLHMEEEAIRHRAEANELELGAAYARDRAQVLDQWCESAKRTWPEIRWHAALDPREAGTGGAS